MGRDRFYALGFRRVNAALKQKALRTGCDLRDRCAGCLALGAYLHLDRRA